MGLYTLPPCRSIGGGRSQVDPVAQALDRGAVESHGVLELAAISLDNPSGANIVGVTGDQGAREPQGPGLRQDETERRGAVALPPFSRANFIADMPAVAAEPAVQLMAQRYPADEFHPVDQPEDGFRHPAGRQPGAVDTVPQLADEAAEVRRQGRRIVFRITILGLKLADGLQKAGLVFFGWRGQQEHVVSFLHVGTAGYYRLTHSVASIH